MSDPYAATTVPQLIGLLEDGGLNAEMAALYRDLIRRMEAAADDVGGKVKVKGKMVITINLDVVGGIYSTEGCCEIKPPKRKPRPTVMYATEDGTLSRTRPNEPDMFLRPAPGVTQGAARLA